MSKKTSKNMFARFFSSKGLQLFLVIAVLVIINLVSFEYRTTWDRSINQYHSLQSATVNYLQSSTIQERKAEVKIIALLKSRTSALHEHLKNTFDQISQVSGQKVSIQIIDTTRQRQDAAIISSGYELNLDRDVVIIDAQTPDLQGTPHIRIIDTDDMLIQGKTSTGISQVRAIQDENLIFSNLIKAIEGEARKVYYLTDGFKFSALSEDNVLTTLRPVLRQSNIELYPLSLTSTQKVPDDAKAIFLLAPQNFPDDQLDILKTYADQKNSAIWISFDANQQPQALRNFLRDYGVHFYRDLVVSKSGSTVKTSSNATIKSSTGFLKGLEDSVTTLRGKTSSMQIDNESQEWLARQIFKDPVLISDEESWSENNPSKTPINYDPLYDQKGPLVLGVTIQQGDQKLFNESRRMVVLGNNNFLLRKNITKEQIDLVSNLTHWLVAREELMGIQPKDLSLYRISMTEDQKRRVQNISIVIIPAVSFLFAFLIWLRRKS